MDATPIDFGDARPLPADENLMGMPSPRRAQSATRASNWMAVHEAARTVGTIAGIDQPQLVNELLRGCVSLDEGPGHASGHAVDDLAEILRRGIAALLIAHTSGGVPQAAALALWHEFLAARDRILAD